NCRIFASRDIRSLPVSPAVIELTAQEAVPPQRVDSVPRRYWEIVFPRLSDYRSATLGCRAALPCRHGVGAAPVDLGRAPTPASDPKLASCSLQNNSASLQDLPPPP